MAIPINPDSADNSADKASVLICTDINYTGTCTAHPTLLGNNNCNYIDGDSSSVHSIKPDNGLDCIFYSNGVCRTFLDPSTESLTILSPGNANLVTISGWTQPLLSYTCVSVKATGSFEGVEVGVQER
ncbi:hypothetical protein SLS55_006319 [Diplodia seriata]|uniref:Uncharacterized protein n=1 Tax=Diplodia seriata TaxID=420778 RepID=A0ABR3CDV6_9PEZI